MRYRLTSLLSNAEFPSVISKSHAENANKIVHTCTNSTDEKVNLSSQLA